MHTYPGSADSTRTIDEQFLELICSDEDLLRAEFDAIIAAEWPSPPATTPRRDAGWRPAREAHRHPRARITGPVARPPQPGVGEWARQRSPPPRQSRNTDTEGR